MKTQALKTEILKNLEKEPISQTDLKETLIEALQDLNEVVENEENKTFLRLFLKKCKTYINQYSTSEQKIKITNYIENIYEKINNYDTDDFYYEFLYELRTKIKLFL